jgi:hypothetical protein
MTSFRLTVGAFRWVCGDGSVLQDYNPGVRGLLHDPKGDDGKDVARRDTKSHFPLVPAQPPCYQTAT